MQPNEKEDFDLKSLEIQERRQKVEQFHIQGFSILRMAQELKVNPRTIVRDIQANRQERLSMLDGYSGSIDWLRNRLGDHVSLMDNARYRLLQIAENSTDDMVKAKALKLATEVDKDTVDTVLKLMWSFKDFMYAGPYLARPVGLKKEDGLQEKA